MATKQYIKCASIYYQNSQTSYGHFSGSGIGVGMGGLGVGIASGTTSGVSQSKLAEMFSPVKNSTIYKADPLPLLWLSVGAIFATCRMSDLTKFFFFPERVPEISVQALTGIFAVLSFFFLIKLFAACQGEDKFTAAILEKFDNNFNKVFYDSENHEIFINENTKISATRDNFIKLLNEG
jgi:hypothetical protein